MDSQVQITLMICLTIIVVYGMSLIKEYLAGEIENTNNKNKTSIKRNGTRCPGTSTGEYLTNIAPPKAGSGRKDTSRLDKVFEKE